MAVTSWGDLSGQIGQIATALGADMLFLERFTMVERMGQPFTMTCEVAASGLVDFSPYLGSAVSVKLAGQALVGRFFTGLLAEASEIDTTDDTVRYLLVLRPWFWFLSLNKNSRIFQNQTTNAIIQKVFTDFGISTDNFSNKTQSAGSESRNYCVQYDESDFAFVSRLMEEEGIYYYFAHAEGTHVMTLCDGPGCHTAFSQSIPLNRDTEGKWTEPRLWTWGAHVRPTPTLVSMRDFHGKVFGNPFAGKSEATGLGSVSPELYYYPGGYSHLSDDGAQDGTAYAGVRLDAARAERTMYTGEGDAFAVPVGDFLTITPVAGDPMDQEASILVVGATHTFEGQKPHAGFEAYEPIRSTIALEGVPKATTWRPLQRTPRPIARGPQVATVVGAAGSVIDPDAYGRVKVQFNWDRIGTNDQNSSCWIRVSQGWADAGFGMIHLPRLGEEVIVDFLDGDLDRPVITGRVYNNSKTVPYALPANKTRSTWKSQTVGKSGPYPDTVQPPEPTDTGYNELRFEDKGGYEEVWMHAQRDFNAWYRFDESRTTGHNTTIKVGYNRDITIKHNETKTVQEGDEKHTISKGNLTTEITQGEETRTIKTGKRTTTIHTDDSTTLETGDHSLTVSQGKSTTTVKGDTSLTVQSGSLSTEVQSGTVSTSSPQKITDTVGGSTVEVTPESIKLSIGGSSIEMTADSIQISSPQITISADATLQASGAQVQISGEAMMQLEAAMIMIN